LWSLRCRSVGFPGHAVQRLEELQRQCQLEIMARCRAEAALDSATAAYSRELHSKAEELCRLRGHIRRVRVAARTQIMSG
jgi:hypothetical protein